MADLSTPPSLLYILRRLSCDAIRLSDNAASPSRSSLQVAKRSSDSIAGLTPTMPWIAPAASVSAPRLSAAKTQ